MRRHKYTPYENIRNCAGDTERICNRTCAAYQRKAIFESGELWDNCQKMFITVTDKPSVNVNYCDRFGFVLGDLIPVEDE